MTALVDQPLLYTEAEDHLSEGVTEDWWGHVKSGSEVSYLLRPETACSLTSILLLSEGSFLISFTAVQGDTALPEDGDHSPSHSLTRHVLGGWPPAGRGSSPPPQGLPSSTPGQVPSSLTLRPTLFPAQDHPLCRMSDSGNVTSFRVVVPLPHRE